MCGEDAVAVGAQGAGATNGCRRDLATQVSLASRCAGARRGSSRNRRRGRRASLRSERSAPCWPAAAGTTAAGAGPRTPRPRTSHTAATVVSREIAEADYTASGSPTAVDQTFTGGGLVAERVADVSEQQGDGAGQMPNAGSPYKDAWSTCFQPSRINLRFDGIEAA